MKGQKKWSPLEKGLAAHYVLAATEGGRYLRPGGFYERLVDAALHADHVNLEQIRAGFPTVAEAVVLYKHRLDGRQRLITRAAEWSVE